MAAIRAERLPDEPTYVSPGGVAEIRLLLQFPSGELTHARVRPAAVSLPSRVHPCSEWFYVLAGGGQLWIGDPSRPGARKGTGTQADDSAADAGGFIVNLIPGRSVRIPPGAPFQYRAAEGDQALDFLVAAMPQWRPEYHEVLPTGRWAPSTTRQLQNLRHLEPQPDTGVLVYHAATAVSYPAPDTSRVTLLGSESNGGLALCELAPWTASIPVRHKTVEELWYVLTGQGEISRRHGRFDPFLTALTPGTCVDIGTGLTFQFRCTGDEPLQMILLTMPQWPGPDEAVPAPELATWPVSVSNE